MDYSQLPDYMEAKELRPLFLNILDRDCLEKGWDPEYVLEQIYELSLRQVYTYEPVQEEIKAQVNSFVLENMNVESQNGMDTIMAMVPLLHLEEVYWTIVRKLPSVKNPQVVALVNRCRKDYGKNFSDPDAESMDADLTKLV